MWRGQAGETNGVDGCSGTGHSEADELMMFCECAEGRKGKESRAH